MNIVLAATVSVLSIVLGFVAFKVTSSDDTRIGRSVLRSYTDASLVKSFVGCFLPAIFLPLFLGIMVPVLAVMFALGAF